MPGTIAKPFLKWAGGKGRLLPQLQPYFPARFNDYFEPFFGGGAVYFSLMPTHGSCINDINDTIMEACLHVKNDLEKLLPKLKTIEATYKRLSEAERQDFYYEQREAFNSAAIGITKTVLLMFLNKTCFNGLYRENSKGKFNVPFGRYANPTICDEANLRAASSALQHTSILTGSYADAVKHAGKGDFVYLDPPYYPLNTTSSFTAYHEAGFAAQDQQNLRDLFVDLDTRGCYVLLSNSTASFVRELYKDYRQEQIYAGRSINASSTKRGKIPELVVLNY